MTDDDKLLDHNYDGIQEYDNDLPRWWLSIFGITTIAAVIYVFYVHGGFRPSDDELLQQAMAKLHEQQAAAQSDASSESESSALVALLGNQEAIDAGSEVFVKNCVACHGSKGEGLIGPNLTDQYWIHGGTPEAIIDIIKKGVPEKGMISWEPMLAEQDILNVTAFIWSIRNTNVAGKAPEGELVTEDSDTPGNKSQSLDAIAQDAARLASGKEVFVKNCVACHGSKGEGLVGPNLTDPYWIHGGTLSDIHTVITEGVVEKGMIAWKTMLKKKEIEDVTAYIWSIRNNNEKGKAPEGDDVTT